VEAIADGIDLAVFDVELRLNGQLVDGETLTATVAVGDAILEESTVVTSGGGKARFELTSLTAETTTVEIDYQNQQQVSQQITFISVLDPIVVSSIVINKNRANANGIDVNTVTAKVTNNITGDPIADVTVAIYLFEPTATNNGSASGPSSATTDVNGEIIVNVTNTQAEALDIRAYYLNSDLPPEEHYQDARTTFYVHNEAPAIVVGGLTWSAPYTYDEAIANANPHPDEWKDENGTEGPNGMTVSRYTWQHASDFCSLLTYLDITDWRLPTVIELLALYDDAAATNPEYAPVFKKHNWPTSLQVWSSDNDTATSHQAVALWNRHISQQGNDYWLYVSCVHEPTP
jgi:hypothetical protein